MRVTLTVYRPGATGPRRNRPSSLERALTAVPSTSMRAPPIVVPSSVSLTLPEARTSRATRAADVVGAPDKGGRSMSPAACSTTTLPLAGGAALLPELCAESVLASTVSAAAISANSRRARRRSAAR
jgi:hypothetical protein